VPTNEGKGLRSTFLTILHLRKFKKHDASKQLARKMLF